MSIGFNMKTLNISEPESLYESLNQMVRFAEYEAVTKANAEEGPVYYLGGLNYHNLSDAGLEEETFGRLRSALEADNILYAIFPDDRRNGHLPLVLNANTRTYLEKNIPELFTNAYVKWFIYKLPGNIDVDDNQRSGSEIIMDETSQHKDESLEVSYDEIEGYIKAYGGVDDGETESYDPDAFNSDIVEEDAEEREAFEQKKREEAAQEKDEIDLGLSDDDVAEREFNPGVSADDVDEEVVEDTPDYEDEFSKMVGSEDTPEDGFDPEVDAEEPDMPLDGAVASDDVTEAEEEGGGDAVDPETNKEADMYLGLPDALIAVLDTVKLHRFAPYRTNNVHVQTKETMQKVVDDANESVAQIESDIKRKLISMYQHHMSESMNQTKASLDEVTGLETVVKFKEKIDNQKAEASENALQAIEDKKKALEDDFNGRQFEDFKNEWLAKAHQLFTDEYYGDRVGVPASEYEDAKKAEAEETEYALQAEYDNWVTAVEENARTTDQARVVDLVAKEMTQLTGSAKEEIRQLQVGIEQQNRDLISAESLEAQKTRDEEYIKSLFEARYEQTDEAKQYKAERDRMAAEKSEKEAMLTAANKKLETLAAENEKSFDDVNEKYQKRLEDIQKNYEIQTAEPAQESTEPVEGTRKKGALHSLKYPLLVLAGAATLVTGGLLGTEFFGEDEPEAAPFSTVALQAGDYSEGDLFSSEINGVERSFEVISVNETSLEVRDTLTNEVSFVPIESENQE